MRDRLVHGYFTVDLEIAAINYFLEKKIVILNNNKKKSKYRIIC